MSSLSTFGQLAKDWEAGLATRQARPKCPRCDGDGSVDNPDYYRPHSWEHTSMRCPECEGTGLKPSLIDRLAEEVFFVDEHDWYILRDLLLDSEYAALVPMLEDLAARFLANPRSVNKYNTTGSCHSDSLPCMEVEDFALQVGQEQQPWSPWRPFGNTEVRTADCITTMVVLRDAYISSRGYCGGYLKSGYHARFQIVQYTEHGYYQEAACPDGHDYCGYCGADNGLGGEFRSGYDCHYCGGN